MVHGLAILCCGTIVGAYQGKATEFGGAEKVRPSAHFSRHHINQRGRGGSMWGLVTCSRAALLAFTSTSNISQSAIISTASRTISKTSLASSPIANGPSKQYLLRYEYVPDILEKRGPHREEHLGIAQQLADEGKCLAGGPSGPVPMEVPTGALFVFADEGSAKQFVEQDPYIKAGLVTKHVIEEWTVAITKKSD